VFPIRQSDAASVVLANDPQQDFMVNRYPWFSISSIQIGRDLASIADEQVLYLTTIGRTTGLLREIKIWFVVCRERFYLLAETGEAAGWVKNIRRNPRVVLRIAERQIDAMAHVLDRQTDRKLWDEVAAIADRKYGWGDGLPVEITPLPSRRTR
jgi:deazaflavin-dependent oxidoreductase (nitroreductase family)